MTSTLPLQGMYSARSRAATRQRTGSEAVRASLTSRARDDAAEQPVGGGLGRAGGGLGGCHLAVPLRLLVLDLGAGRWKVQGGTNY